MSFIHVVSPNGQRVLHDVGNITRIFTEDMGYGKLNVVAQLRDKPQGTVTILYAGDEPHGYMNYLVSVLNVIDYENRGPTLEETIDQLDRTPEFDYESFDGLGKETGTKEELPATD